MGYLKYDYSLSCMASEYVHGWIYYASFMVLVYPIGIPCVYLVLVYRDRHCLNPAPWFVIADVKNGGKFSETENSKTEISKEMKSLAEIVTKLRQDAADVRSRAEHTHIADKIGNAIEAELALAGRNPSPRRSSSSFMRKAAEGSVAKNWEIYLPKEAALAENLETYATVVEKELVSQHREANPRVRLLGFLVRAYEPCFYFWESVECARRLALTGLLVFFGEGSRQIVMASFIALASLFLYSKFRPYQDDARDTLASVAQLMIFIGVFVALLLRAHIVFVDGLSAEWVSGIMTTANLAFLFYSTPLFPLLGSGIGKVIDRINPADKDPVSKIARAWRIPDTDLRPAWKMLLATSAEAESPNTNEKTDEQTNGEVDAEQTNGEEATASEGVHTANVKSEPPALDGWIWMDGYGWIWYVDDAAEQVDTFSGHG